MKVLIADKYPEDKIDKIKEIGYEVIYDPGLKEESLIEGLKQHNPDTLIVRSTKVKKEMIDSSDKLSLIIRAGSGYDTIDIESATERNVFVANCPGKNSIAVAELAFGLILSLDRRIPDNVRDLREGKWNKNEYSKARGIYGKTFGIVGVGKIGRELILRAKAFGMKVVAWSRSLTPEKADELGIGFLKSPVEVASNADVVSVHLALTEDTRNMIGSDFFNAMKPGAYFINTSRSEIVDEKALLKAIAGKGIRAGLDVVSAEPAYKEGEFPDDIGRHDGLYCTHHIGASTDQAQSAVADESVRILDEYKKSGNVLNCVNPGD